MQDSTPQEPSVDFELLNSIFDNDPDQVREVLNLYLEQASAQIEGMGAAIAAGNAPDLNRLAHKCAGSSASCGMNNIVPLLRELERMGKESQLAEAPEFYGLVQAEFQNIRQILIQHLGQ
jgi:HPt (histidine-containing phosphotransfer) domain-containing protein